MKFSVKSYGLFLLLVMISSCMSQKNTEAYIQELNHQSLLLDAGTGLKKETIVTGMSDGKTDTPGIITSLICNPQQPRYIKVEKKMMVNYAYNYQFYYKDKKLIKAKINIRNNEGSEDQQVNYSAVYYLRDDKCIKSIDEDRKWSDCKTIKEDSRSAFSDGFQLMNLILRVQ